MITLLEKTGSHIRSLARIAEIDAGRISGLDSGNDALAALVFPRVAGAD
jgi:hypothetical protein